MPLLSKTRSHFQNLDMPATLELAAACRWRALRDLNHSSERAELAAAGVSERRIDALYPYSFDRIIPGLIPTITQKDLASMKPMLLPRTRSLWDKLPGQWQQRFRIAVQANGIENSGWNQLVTHIYDGLTFSGGRLTYARAVADRLHELCWYMEHEPQLHLGHEVHAPFVLIADMLLPGLLAQHAVKNASFEVAASAEVR